MILNTKKDEKKSCNRKVGFVSMLLSPEKAQFERAKRLNKAPRVLAQTLHVKPNKGNAMQQRKSGRWVRIGKRRYHTLTSLASEKEASLIVSFQNAWTACRYNPTTKAKRKLRGRLKQMELHKIPWVEFIPK